MEEEKYVLKCNVHEKLCEFSCPNDTPIPMAKEALCQFIKHVCNIEDQQRLEAEAKAKEKEEVVEVEKIEKKDKGKKCPPKQ